MIAWSNTVRGSVVLNSLVLLVIALSRTWVVLVSRRCTKTCNILSVRKLGPRRALTSILATIASPTSSVVDRPVTRMRLVRMVQRNSWLVGALVLLLIHIAHI